MKNLDQIKKHLKLIPGHSGQAAEQYPGAPMNGRALASIHNQEASPAEQIRSARQKMKFQFYLLSHVLKTMEQRARELERAQRKAGHRPGWSDQVQADSLAEFLTVSADYAGKALLDLGDIRRAVGQLLAEHERRKDLRD